MKKIHIITLAFLLVATSCSTLKQVRQEKTLSQTEISSSEITVSESQIFSVTKIIETMDTSVVFPASQLTMNAKFQSLLDGDTIYATGEDLCLNTFYDSLTRTIKTQASVKTKSVPVQFQKVTETRQVAIRTVTTNKQEQQKQTIQTENKDKQVQRNSLPWRIILIMIVVVICIIGWAVLKFKRYL